MKGVLLINMGGPLTEEDMKSFLQKMFLDPFIIPYNSIVRKFLSLLISNLRYKSSWRKYQLINGTPIIKNTVLLTEALQKELDNDYIVKFAFSYSDPLIENVLDEFRLTNINDITAIPLYPQPSFVTTGSVKNSITPYLLKYPGINVKITDGFYRDSYFIDFWVDLIRQHINRMDVAKPLLIFSAHSLPLSWVKKGDTYPETVFETADLISKKLNYDHIVAFQSSMTGSKWQGPELKGSITGAIGKGFNSIIIIPVSFTSENLETLYDLDKLIIPFFAKDVNVKHISRVKIPIQHNIFLEMLKNKIHE